jgi:hypothetical protein
MLCERKNIAASIKVCWLLGRRLSEHCAGRQLDAWFVGGVLSVTAYCV